MRECGATTDFSTQVSVVPAGGELPHAPANVFISVADGAEPRTSWGGPPAAIEWQGDRSIVVRYHSKSKVLLSRPQVEVSISWLERASVTIDYTMVDDVAEPANRAVNATHSAVTARAYGGTRRAGGCARYRGR